MVKQRELREHYWERDPEYQQLPAIIQEKVRNALTGAQINLMRASKAVPLNQIATNVAEFQIRREAHSERSVTKYITSILQGRFNQKLLDDCLLWFCAEDNQLYILAGHSRFETQKRLTDPEYIYPPTGKPLCEHPMVKKVQQEQQIDFSYLNAKIYLGQQKKQAKRLASISNTLGTPERQVDRAMFYQAERQARDVTDQELAGEFRELEGSHWHNLIHLSYLDPNGRTLTTLASFKEGAAGYKNIFKPAVWIGYARKKLPELTVQHENELFERLITCEVYGKSLTRRSTFMDELRAHLDQIDFQPDKPLNVKKLKITHPAMQEYYKLLESINNELQQARKRLRQLNERAATIKLHEDQSQLNKKLDALATQQQQQLSNILQLTIPYELLTALKETGEETGVKETTSEQPTEVWEAYEEEQLHQLIYKANQIVSYYMFQRKNSNKKNLLLEPQLNNSLDYLKSNQSIGHFSNDSTVTGLQDRYQGA